MRFVARSIIIDKCLIAVNQIRRVCGRTFALLCQRGIFKLY